MSLSRVLLSHHRHLLVPIRLSASVAFSLALLLTVHPDCMDNTKFSSNTIMALTTIIVDVLVPIRFIGAWRPEVTATFRLCSTAMLAHSDSIKQEWSQKHHQVFRFIVNELPFSRGWFFTTLHSAVQWARGGGCLLWPNYLRDKTYFS